MIQRIQTLEEYRTAYQKSVQQSEAFWAETAHQFTWKEPWDKVLDWEFDTPDVNWFSGGKLNITENCIDRHLKDRGDQTAIIWEPNEPESRPRELTYNELHTEVCKLANALKEQGVEKGDRVCMYMPMVPELAISLLACARIGAVHSVVFAGFSAQALADRIKDAEAKVVLTADGNFRGAKEIEVKRIVDNALDKGCDSVDTVFVYRRTGAEVEMAEGRDIWWHEAVSGQDEQCPAEPMDAEDMLFILYTSGSTGKPKGVVHTIGGYMVYTAYTFRNVFQYEDGDIYWCTADIGWITGHSYIVYGPLLEGATTVMFEGVPTYPDPSRFWQICKKFKVNQFYTAPTAIRALMAKGDEWIDPFDLSDLKVLGTVGEPINDEAWEWYYHKVGRGRCPVVDTWWQTETGGIMISTIPDVTPMKPTFASLPLPGIQPVLVDKEGNELTENGVEGLLCIKFPWPGMLRTTYGDHRRCRRVYFSHFKGKYFTGDGAKRNEDGLYRIIGRVDDVINVSGHRLGTAEIEDAIDDHKTIVESAVIGYPHEIKGQGIFAFLIVNQDIADEEAFRKEIDEVVRKQIGPIAKPDKVLIVDDLPKTRSGKIMRRILRKISRGEGDQLGDISTLLNPEAVQSIKEKAEEIL